MKNVTIAIDDETHRKARIRAAELGTSLSAMVKDYLNQLADAPQPHAPNVQGVREMPMNYTAQPVIAPLSPPKTDRPPWLVDGKWVYTRDGKPRKPGAMRNTLWVADDFDEWPDGFIDAMYGEDTEAANNWWKPYAKAPKKSNPK
jgi:plasmid stability protein